ncbi:DUF1428 family protein [Nitrosospira multiformis]|nr:DUF1428 family protein [Nitrosospira multiformis]
MDSLPPCLRPIVNLPAACGKGCLGIREYGALNVVECWGDDVPEGKLTS